MPHTLNTEELVALVTRVFKPQKDDKAIAILADLPDNTSPDTEAWRERREMAADWALKLDAAAQKTGVPAHLFLYPNVGMNNADLPQGAHRVHGPPLPNAAEELSEKNFTPFTSIFNEHRLLVALTHFSATAPLKLMAQKYGLRAATMPGFSKAMIPALRLDYTEINRRVHRMKELLDNAISAHIEFQIDSALHRLDLDLRHRTAHASGGLFLNAGSAGNLPSGETYIVPYEGEKGGDPSRSFGELPVQFGDEIVLYIIEENRARRVQGTGPMARAEAARLQQEPAYGNLAELGLGVLADFGVQPTGQVLLDEKLGLHIAFGRSDHFGGMVGAKDFSSPGAVVHIDRVYVPSTQPRICVKVVELEDHNRKTVQIIREDRYILDW